MLPDVSRREPCEQESLQAVFVLLLFLSVNALWSIRNTISLICLCICSASAHCSFYFIFISGLGWCVGSEHNCTSLPQACTAVQKVSPAKRPVKRCTVWILDLFFFFLSQETCVSIGKAGQGRAGRLTVWFTFLLQAAKISFFGNKVYLKINRFLPPAALRWWHSLLTTPACISCGALGVCSS